WRCDVKLKSVLFAVSALAIVGCGPMTPTEDGGTGGGGGGSVTGGGGGATGGGGGGGGDVDAGVTDAGTDAGMDAGIDCMTVTLDPKVGDLVLRNGATAGAAASLPTGVSTIGVLGSTLYGIGADKQFHALGTLPTLTLGPALGSVVSPADVDAGVSVFMGGSLATSGTQLLAGYTKSGAGFPGNVAVYDTADAGLRHVSAPSNYTAVGFQGSFLINGGGLGAATGANIYVLDAQGEFGLTSFDAAWMASSGYTGATANGVLLLGYFDGTDFKNHVRAAPPSLYASALTNRNTFVLASAGDVISGEDLLDLTTVGNDAVVVRGGYDSNFELFTSAVERVPLTLAGSGTQTVTAGTPVTLLEATNLCTKVNFVVGAGNALLVGLQDRNGKRVVSIQP
ncbi:MAG TPA: hypothetical protein VGE37_07180, partial [Archangium sp.]